MRYRRMPIEIESPEQFGYERIKINLTESSFTDAKLEGLGGGLDAMTLCYTDHLGDPGLRELIAAEGEGLGAEDVTVTPGAAAALYIIATSLLERGSHVVVAHPNYATNIETPRALGCRADFLELEFEQGFRVDTERLAAMVTPGTKLVSLTSPHNPTGSVLCEEDLREVVRIVEKAGCRLLLDETYRDMSFAPPPPLAASLSPRAISVTSLSKSYGLPGIRMGWAVTRDPELQETFLAAKEQIFICNSVLDEEVARRALSRKAELLPAIKEKIAAGFGIVKEWIEGQSLLEWVEPAGGVVCFPRFRAGAGVDPDKFYSVLNDEFGTFVGPGHWFEMERRYMRIGYGWPALEQLREGLANISRAAEKAAV